MKRWMTRLAFAGKCGALTASGPATAAGAAWDSWARTPASPSMPKPVPERRSMSRRDRLTFGLAAKNRASRSFTRNPSVSNSNRADPGGIAEISRWSKTTGSHVQDHPTPEGSQIVLHTVCDPSGVETFSNRTGGLRPPANVCDPSGIENDPPHPLLQLFC